MVLSVAGNPYDLLPFTYSVMNAALDFQDDERCPESEVCAQLESKLSDLIKRYSHTVGMLLNMKDASEAMFSEVFGKYDGKVALFYDQIESTLGQLEKLSMENRASRDSLGALAQLRDALTGADMREEADFDSEKTRKALLLEYVMPSWEYYAT